MNNNKYFDKKVLPIAIIAGALGLDVTVASAQSDDLANLGLEEIIVTATRKETSLQDTAVAVTALSAQDLENQNVETLQDVANYTPGLQIVSFAGGGNARGNVVLRGIGADALDSQASVGTYIDEVYFPSAFGNVLGLLDLQRIEVLRGPQGTLFGRNTIAGAIQYVSQTPTNEFEGNIKATLGNLDRQTIEAAASIPVTESFNLRVAAIDDEKGGYVEDLLNDVDRGEEETSAGRIRALWEATDRLVVDVKVETIDVETNGRPAIIGNVNPLAQFPFLAANPAFFLPPELAPFVPPVDTSGFTNEALVISSLDDPDNFQNLGYDFPDFLEFEYDVVQANISYDLTDDITISSITSSVSSETSYSQDFDLTPIRILSVQQETEIDAFTQEIKLSGAALDDRLSFTTGLFYYDDESIGQATPASSIGNFIVGVDLNGRGVVETESAAFYGQATYDISERVGLTLGVRYTDETITTSLTNVPNSDLEFSFDDVSPHLGLQVQLTDNHMVYAKASKGFRAGGNTANVNLENNGRSFDPEEAWTYEAGARLDLVDGRLRINPTVYFTEWSDLQSIIIEFTGGGPVATTQNVGDAEIMGFELESKFLVTEGLTLNLAASIIDAEYTRVTESILQAGQLSLDSDLQAAPDLKYTIGANYSTSLPKGMLLNANIDYSWVDEQRSAVQDRGAVNIPDYGLLGARISVDVSEQLNIALWGSNLTNEGYLIGATDFANGGTAGILEYDVGRPRTYGLEGRFNF